MKSRVVVTKVNFFVYERRQRRHRRRHQGYEDSSPDFRHGEINKTIMNIRN